MGVFSSRCPRRVDYLSPRRQDCLKQWNKMLRCANTGNTTEFMEAWTQLPKTYQKTGVSPEVYHDVLDKRSAFLESYHRHTSDPSSSALHDPSLLKFVTDFAFPMDFSKTCLHEAVTGDQLDMVKLLISIKAPVNARDESGNTALLTACKTDKRAILDYLVMEAKAEPNLQCLQQSTPLMWTSWRGNLEGTLVLLENKANPNLQSIHRQSALLFACYDGHTDVVRLLLGHKANSSVTNDVNQNPLINSSYKGRYSCVKLVLDDLHQRCLAQPENLVFSQFLDHQDNDGCTALMFAAWNSHPKVVQLLLDTQANPNVQDNKGRTALMMAAWNIHPEIIRKLTQHPKTETEIKDADMNSAMDWVQHNIPEETKREDKAIVVSLLQASADCNIKDKENRTALYTIVSVDGAFETTDITLGQDQEQKEPSD